MPFTIALFPKYNGHCPYHLILMSSSERSVVLQKENMMIIMMKIIIIIIENEDFFPPKPFSSYGLGSNTKQELLNNRYFKHWKWSTSILKYWQYGLKTISLSFEICFFHKLKMMYFLDAWFIVIIQNYFQMLTLRHHNTF